MLSLNLPSFEFKLKDTEGKIWIFDVIRKKYVVLTDEEWVRQHMVHFLIDTLKYPKSLIKIESGLVYNNLGKRSDIVVFNREGKHWMLIECKAPAVQLNQQTLQQVSVYNKTLQAKYIVISNGLNHYCLEVDHVSRKTLILGSFPDFQFP